MQELDFTEDDTKALGILFQVAHLQFEQVPVTLGYKQLVEVATLCDKFDCAKLVKPWLEVWLKGEESKSMVIGQENWLFIAWVFGRREVFETLAKRLVMEIRISESGGLCSKFGMPLEEPMPPAITGMLSSTFISRLFGEMSLDFLDTQMAHEFTILDSICAIRLNIIKELLEIPYTTVRQLLSARSPRCRRGDDACDSLIYGSIIRGLERANLWPRKQPEDIRMNVTQVSNALKTLKIHRLCHCENPDVKEPGRSHRGCGKSSFTEKVEHCLSVMPDPVLDIHRKHMQRQHDILFGVPEKSLIDFSSENGGEIEEEVEEDWEGVEGVERAREEVGAKGAEDDV